MTGARRSAMAHRLPKFHTRVEAYGGIDEANAVIGVALRHVADENVRAELTRIQNDLFDLGAGLCRPEREHLKVAPLRMAETQVTWIEETIDRYNATLPPLNSFVLPGGSAASAYLHHARTVIRRAERGLNRDRLSGAGQSGRVALCQSPFRSAGGSGADFDSAAPFQKAAASVSRAESGSTGLKWMSKTGALSFASCDA
jgi:ATP:cob(I)alamin adenosyltransferase